MFQLSGFVVELFSGYGVNSASLCCNIGVVCISFEIAPGPEFNLTRSAVTSSMLGWIRGHLVAAVWCAFPCSTWSNARRPMIRSKQELWGLAGAKADEHLGALLAVGNKTLRVAHCVGRACLRADVPAVFENPLTSLAWQTPGWKALMRDPRVQVIDLDQCQFGAQWKKATRLLAINVCVGHGLARRCSGRHGRCSATNAPQLQSIGPLLSRRSAQYPPQLASHAAAALVKNAEQRALAKILRFA